MVLGLVTSTQCPTLSKAVTQGNEQCGREQPSVYFLTQNIWKVKTCEAEIQSGKWKNDYKIIQLHLLVLYYCISTDLTKVY